MIYLPLAMALLALLPTTDLRAQIAWDHGSASMDIGFPVPDETWSVEGPVLNLDMPGQGVGAFNVATGDTNIFMAMAYEFRITDTDTLADLLLVYIQDTIPVVEGQYPVSPLTGTGTLFGWFPDLSAETLVGLVDTAFTIDSLLTLDAYIALSGMIAIDTLESSTLDISFYGNLLGASFEFLTVQNGGIRAESNLPSMPYALGRYQSDDGAFFWEVEGELNPLTQDRGVGALELVSNDTLTFMVLAYWPAGDGQYQAHGLVIREESAAFGTHEYTLGIPTADFPLSFAFETAPLSLLALVDLFAGEIPLEPGELGWYSTNSTPFSLEQGEDYLYCDFTAEYLNLDGSSRDLSESWNLGNAWETLSSRPISLGAPSQPWLGAAYPNPFNAAFHLPLELPHEQQVQVELVDMLGRTRSTLFSGHLSSGAHRLNLEVDDPTLASGWYACRVTRGDGAVMTRSLLYLK